MFFDTHSAYFETLETICRALDIDIKDLLVLED
ncbi:helix-turn-helix domain-containing protein [Paenibacillus lentus]|uniref:HTH cro/C1-type domain-containing protein n=1 Tax=Paenibacillus lentus TaxID=1338368 RepID=A0A3S8RWE3_9BACL|nr:hypothetical protein EIM92_15170 [Paenibacillus lentus]